MHAKQTKKYILKKSIYLGQVIKILIFVDNNIKYDIYLYEFQVFGKVLSVWKTLSSVLDFSEIYGTVIRASIFQINC